MTSIVTYGVKYIGSKKSLLEKIIEFSNETGAKSVIDAFTGTTRVAQAYRQSGYDVVSSDLAWASEPYAYTYLISTDNNRVQHLVDMLNNLPGEEDWITKNYCDVTSDDGGIIRVWQKKNGMRADAIRNKIEELDVSREEKMILITSLIHALDRVDNTVGVQQAYLKTWCKRSFNDLKIVAPPTVNGKPGVHFVGNCLEIDYPESDIAYLDPPYSSHSYASYYHIWDSITRWDKPEVALKTNRRIDRVKGEKFDESMRSTWNVRTEALNSFVELIYRLPVKYVLISYNDESIIKKKDLLFMCECFNSFEVREIDYKRNIMSTIGNAQIYKNDGFKTKNKELLILIEK
jgi:adenine-specific DNA-methyltransferase